MKSHDLTRSLKPVDDAPHRPRMPCPSHGPRRQVGNNMHTPTSQHRRINRQFGTWESPLSDLNSSSSSPAISTRPPPGTHRAKGEKHVQAGQNRHNSSRSNTHSAFILSGFTSDVNTPIFGDTEVIIRAVIYPSPACFSVGYQTRMANRDQWQTGISLPKTILRKVQGSDFREPPLHRV